MCVYPQKVLNFNSVQTKNISLAAMYIPVHCSFSYSECDQFFFNMKFCMASQIDIYLASFPVLHHSCGTSLGMRLHIICAPRKCRTTVNFITLFPGSHVKQH